MLSFSPKYSTWCLTRASSQSLGLFVSFGLIHLHNHKAQFNFKSALRSVCNCSQISYGARMIKSATRFCKDYVAHSRGSRFSLRVVHPQFWSHLGPEVA